MPTEIVPAKVKEVQGMLATYQEDIARALAGKIPPEYFLQCAATAIRRDPSMLDPRCRPSLVAAVFQSAQCHLPIGDGTHRACLVKYGTEVQFQPMYRGLLDHAYNSGQVKSVAAEVVYPEDRFTWNGPSRPVDHQPPWDGAQDIAKALGAYAQAETVLGGWIAVRMTRKQIEAIKKRSAAYRASSGPWCDKDQEPSMWAKTVLRQLCQKRLPSSVFPLSIHRALEIEDAREFKNAREAEIEVHNPAPLPEPGSSPAEIDSLRQSLKELLATLPPDKSDAILEASGIPKLEECTDAVLMRKAYKAAEEEAVA